MPKLTVDGKTAEFPRDKRLVLAIEKMGINIGHRCGGNARCTTCRVSFVYGEPAVMTRAEFEKLAERELLGQVRLSCQLTVMQDMEVRALKTKESAGWPDTGPRPADEVVPEPRWYSRSELERSF